MTAGFGALEPLERSPVLTSRACAARPHLRGLAGGGAFKRGEVGDEFYAEAIAVSVLPGFLQKQRPAAVGSGGAVGGVQGCRIPGA